MMEKQDVRRCPNCFQILPGVKGIQFCPNCGHAFKIIPPATRTTRVVEDQQIYRPGPVYHPPQRPYLNHEKQLDLKFFIPGLNILIGSIILSYILGVFFYSVYAFIFLSQFPVGLILVLQGTRIRRYERKIMKYGEQITRIEMKLSYPTSEFMTSHYLKKKEKYEFKQNYYEEKLDNLRSKYQQEGR
ncbi:MAG: hypothetical protein ACFFCS_10760 [Candidatus Hodarchaeota archaeon]